MVPGGESGMAKVITHVFVNPTVTGCREGPVWRYPTK